MKRLFLLIALGTGFNSIPASAKVDPRAIAFIAAGTYVGIGSLHSLVKKSFICEKESNESQISTSDKVIRQINRILDKVGAFYTFIGAGAIASRASVGKIGGTENGGIAGGIIGALTICAGYSLLKCQPSLICRNNERYATGEINDDVFSSRTLRQINRILGKAGALGLIYFGGILIAGDNWYTLPN